MKKVNSEGEEPAPISSSYINTNASCIFIYIGQECSNPLLPSLFTTLRAGQVGQVPETQAIFCGLIEISQGRGSERGGGGGGFQLRRRGEKDPNVVLWWAANCFQLARLRRRNRLAPHESPAPIAVSRQRRSVLRSGCDARPVCGC